MKMHEAATMVLQDATAPMHAREIYEEIERRGLFRFGAKNPVAVLSQTLRQKSNIGRIKGRHLFIKTGPATYKLP